MSSFLRIFNLLKEKKIRKTSKQIIEELQNRRIEARAGGGVDRVNKQHDTGKLTARERIEIFLDKHFYFLN